MNKIAIIGAGGFGKRVLNILRRINGIFPQYDIIGFYDDGYREGEIINGIPVLGGLDKLNCVDERIDVVLALGWSSTRKKVYELIDNRNLSFPTIVDPSATMPDMTYSKIGKGCIICESVLLTCNIEIDDFVILNMGTVIGHDVKIAKFVSTMPSVNISGEVCIEEGAYIGVGAIVINQINVGANSIVGAGAVVTHSLPDNCTAVGVPAKPIKFR